MSISNGRDFDVVIVGAGVIGAVMASLLVARKLCAPGRVAVIADRPATAPAAGADWDARVFALGRASQRLLEACGVWDALPAQRRFAYERMCVWDAAGEPGGSASLRFDCAEIGEPNLGHIVDGRVLQWQCLQAARAAGAVLIEAGLEAVSATDADISVRLSDARVLRGQLLIAADGHESKARALLGIDTAGHAYQQDALVAHVHTAKSHGNTAWQRFLCLGPLAFLPLPDGRSSIVWSTTVPEAARLRALDPEAFGAALTAAGGGALGECTLSTPPTRYPLKLQYALDYARPRAVLIGDAAHVVHPLAGQGLNLGLLDCAVLADVLGQAGAGAFFGEHKLLRRYERRRRSENLLAAGAFDGLERLFSAANPLSRGLRAAGLSAVGSVPSVKRHLAQRALGLIGDVPDFLRADRVSPHR
jgi:ubiquinone biosynthesis UbiH/UbiF/VisC/COQ6 family hydroxylase